MPINNPANISISPDRASAATELTNSLSTTASNPITANTARKGLTIFNTLNTTVYVDSTNAVTASNFMFKLEAGSFYEMPQPIYTGALWLMLASGTGSVEIRELT